MARRIKKSPLTELRDRPAKALHPFEVFLLERRIPLTEAARALGWSPRKVFDAIRWLHRPRDLNLADIARELGFEDVLKLFPEYAPGDRYAIGYQYKQRKKEAASSTKKKENDR